LRVLHLHSSFSAGGKELRAVRLMNAFGPKLEHTVVSAQPGAYGAAVVIDPSLSVRYPENFPGLQGIPSPGRLWRIAKALRGHDLILTYNWGAMDAVLAHALFRGVLRLPPLVHHEDGFNEDEADGLKPLRNWFRRLALRGAPTLVVPSRRLEGIALEAWHQPRGRVKVIANGIDCAAYIDRPRPDILPGIAKHPGEKWVGTLAGLRPVKNLPRLVRAFAALPEDWRLVILGEGPERAAIMAQAEASGVAGRVHLPGFVTDPSHAVGLFDLFALSSDSEQFPISVVEAMAAGLAVAAPAVGDVAGMVSAENRGHITTPGDEQGLAEALLELGCNPDLRQRIGAANRAHAQAHYDESTMISAYRRVYGQAVGDLSAL
jgi:glycosyltransferase involved in cell wall biosynthesis